MKAVKYLVMGAFVFGLSAPVMAQDYISAIENVSKALKSDPSGAAGAKQVVKDYLKQFKKDPKALVALGNSYLAVKNYDQANAIADMALKKNKNFGDAYILKGDAEVLKDDGGNAAMWYQQAMQLDPKNPMGYTRYANVYRKRSPSESERVLNELRANVPEYPIDAEMGHNYYESGNDAKAFEAFSKAKINSISESYIAEYILSAFSTGKYDKGLEVAKTAISRFPKNKAFLRLAMFNAVEANSPEGVSFAEQLISSSDVEKRSNDFNYYARALMNAGKLTEAIEQFNKAFSMDNTQVANLQSISEAYTALGDMDKAEEFSIKYLENNPNAKPSEYSKLASVYIEKTKEAMELAKEAKEAKKNAEVDQYNADASSNWQKALNIYDKLVAKHPHTADYAAFQKGHQAFVLGMDDEAIRFLQPLVNTIKAKGDLSDDDKYYLSNSSFDLGYIYWSGKNDLDAAKPFFQDVYNYSTVESHKNIAKKALGLDEEEQQ